ncbi:ribonuclease H [Holospora elegans E1]|uniref:ribonuclease H n=1 Tax=Holospora elegans E1 TaxID=1427503 RepID=A0A023DZZ7_9PROT|nr:ribonuclease HI [Holospora elegans]GAJ46690.1 ribonuclease H [Holospora elegans E1]
MVWLFTDGACSGNPGPGAWAWIRQDDKERVQEAGYEENTTNNRMELSAALYGLASLSTQEPVTVVSDSSYLVKGMEEWVGKWQRNGWINSQKKPVENQDLWKLLLQQAQRFSKIHWNWVKGHANHQGNIDADELARKTLKTKKNSSKSFLEPLSEKSLPWQSGPVISGIWIGDKTSAKGLLTSFPNQNSISILHFKNEVPVLFKGHEWQIFCLEKLKKIIKDVPFWGGGKIAITVVPAPEELEFYKACNFSPTSQGGASTSIWSLFLVIIFGIFGCLEVQASDKNPPARKKELFHAYLKAKRVYWRAGPGSEHSVLWSYSCPGWPVFIRKRWSYWCQVEDIKGAIGWVHGSLLAFQRVAFVLYQKTPLRSRPSSSGAIKAYLQQGVLGLCLKEEGKWLYVRLLKERYEGWVHVQHIWNPCKVVS